MVLNASDLIEPINGVRHSGAASVASGAQSITTGHAVAMEVGLTARDSGSPASRYKPTCRRPGMTPHMI